MPAPTESFDLATASPLTAAGLRGDLIVPVADPAGPLCDCTTLGHLVRYAISAATGLLKGNGYTVAPATAGVDYLAPAGDGSQLTGRNFLHTQASASATWTVNHNLGRRVGVEVTTLGGVAVNAAVQQTSLNQVVVQFATATAGYAIIT